MTNTIKGFLLSFFICTLLSCEKDVVYEYEIETFDSNHFDQCNYEQCPDVHITYIMLQSPPALIQAVNQKIEALLIDGLTFEGQEAKTIEQAIEKYLSNAQTSYPEDSILSERHEFSNDISVSYTSNGLFCLRSEFYQFAGGAHGISSISYWNFNPKSSKAYKETEIFKDIVAFTTFAKTAFIKTYGTLENFWFEDEIFTLPANIGFDENGIILFYNVYEIAPYSEGDFELRFSWEEVEDYLAF